jgi:hypothetical protein
MYSVLLKWKPTRSEDKECLLRPRAQLPDGHLVTGLDANVQSEDAQFCLGSIGQGEEGYMCKRHRKFNIEVQRFDAAGRFLNHSKHACKVCNNADAGHRSSVCPAGSRQIFFQWMHGTPLQNKRSIVQKPLKPSS